MTADDSHEGDQAVDVNPQLMYIWCTIFCLFLYFVNLDAQPAVQSAPSEIECVSITTTTNQPPSHNAYMYPATVNVVTLLRPRQGFPHCQAIRQTTQQALWWPNEKCILPPIDFVTNILIAPRKEA
jgi:hypothetical protein